MSDNKTEQLHITLPMFVTVGSNYIDSRAGVLFKVSDISYISLSKLGVNATIDVYLGSYTISIDFERRDEAVKEYQRLESLLCCNEGNNVA